AYFLLREVDGEVRAVVIDPGLRDGGWVKEVLGIGRCEVIFTHFHLDHWIGYEPYLDSRFYASPLCKMVLTQMVGVERTGKSVFVEGRLNDYHRRPLPLRAANDAERLLPFRGKILEVTGEQVYRNELFALEFFELPYGQTEGTLYGLLDTGSTRVLFAGDLFIHTGGVLKVEPHYAFKPKRMVIEDIAVMLRAILGRDLRVEPSPTDLEHLKKVASPDLIALGHGLIPFRDFEESIAHLLEELEELIRIDREHVI
ncbi:MAG: MBL fold metallo-hydrolase, partial [Thermacetogeniaceae bacterium]